MTTITRFSVSIETDLLDQFLTAANNRGWGNRSEALRHLVRDFLVREEWRGNEEIVGTIAIVYDHHKRDLADSLTDIQHDHHENVLATTHIHLDRDNCLEMIAVRGAATHVQKIADALIGARGVKHGRLIATTTGKELT